MSFKDLNGVGAAWPDRLAGSTLAFGGGGRWISSLCLRDHDCRGLICLGRVVLRCLKDKRLFSRSLFFTISTRHGIMESWNHRISMFGLQTWFVSGYCIGARSRWFKAFQKSFKLFFGFPFHMGSHEVFHSMFFVVRPESEDLRIDIAVLLESLIMGSFQAATPPPRINAFLCIFNRGYQDPNKSLYTMRKPSLPTVSGWGSTPKKNIQTYILILIFCTRNS